MWQRLGEKRFWRVRWGLIILLIVASTITGIDHAVELRRALIDYATQWDARHALLENAAASGIVDVAVPEITESFRLDDISDDSSFWVNQCMADYYGLGAVRRE